MREEIIKILLVEDDEDDYIMTRDLLSEIEKERYDLQWVSKYDPALELMMKNMHDIFLLDYRLGDRTGLDLLNEALKNGCKPPIILLTGQGDHEVDLEAMKSGASDYLIKGHINAPLLERSIRYAIERKRTEERIARMAYYDFLTSLPNRIMFQERLKHAIAYCERHKTLVAILFLDLDNFKRINDTLGHSIGDQLLRSTAEKLNSVLRKTDATFSRNIPNLFARLGGDEFTVLLSEIRETEDAARVAQRIIDTLSKPFIIEKNEIFITFSIGISIYPHDGDDIDTLIKNADAAMYHAKEQGKNNYQYYRHSMNAAALEKLTIENSLRKALDREEFLLYYQPQFDVKTGKISGLEALLRWQHPERGLVPPAEFIYLAEDSGLIIPIGEWVLQTACRQNKTWQTAGLPRIPISVNLSGKQLMNRKIIKVIAQILDSAKLAPEYLLLEITESVLMQNTEENLLVLHQLRNLGLRFIMDDFGTGYSSLSYLKRFPLCAIKCDRSFISGITINPDDAVIVQAIISLAHNLKLRVIAEGVETEKQSSFLNQHDCDEMQGYLLSRPVPAKEIPRLLSENANALRLASLTGAKIL